MIVAFHPLLSLDRIIIYRSFSHSIEQLSNLDYLSREQITCIEPYLTHMLKDAACEVSKRNCKDRLGQMFSIESAMIKKTLFEWFNLKFKRQIEKLNPIQKIQFESKK